MSTPRESARDNRRIQSLEAKTPQVEVDGTVAQINVGGPTKIHGHDGTGEGGALVKPLYYEGAAPATPPAGYVVVYAKTDGLMYQKDDAGTETLLAGGGGGGSVATDAIWDAAGDLAIGTGANTAARLAITVPAANIINVLGVVNGETTATWKSLMDATVATTQAFGDAASAGTGTLLARITHKHAMPAVAGIWPVMSAATQLTIASGAITVTQDHHEVIPESGAADDLVTINGSVANKWLMLRTGPDANNNVITIKGGGNIWPLQNGGGDIILSTDLDYALLWYQGGAAGPIWIAFQPGQNPSLLVAPDAGAAGMAIATSTDLSLFPNPGSVGVVNVHVPTLLVSTETLSTGRITGSEGAYSKIAGEGGVADNIASLQFDTPIPKDGTFAFISASDDAVTITVKNNDAEGATGFKIFTQGAADIVLDGIEDVVLLIYNTLLDSGNGGWMAGLIGGDTAAALAAHLADTSDAHDASAISIVDAGTYFTGTDVEAALQELGAAGGGAAAVDDLTDADTTTTPPTLSDVLKWNGTNWVPAAYNYSFTYTLDSFTGDVFLGSTTALIGSGNWKAIGGASFTAAYSNKPVGTTASVALTGSASDWSGLALASATGPTTNATAITYPTTRTGTLTVTVTPTNSPTPATRTDTQTFSNTMRYGTNANGIGAQTEANLEALTEVAGPNESRDQTISNIPTGTAGHFLTFGYGASLSNIAQVQMDEGFGFATASFNSTATTLAPAVQTPVTNVANSAGFSESFDAITSRLADLPNGTRDFKLLTTSTAINYIYWGELNVASTADGAAVYTEANVEGNYATAPGKVASNSISSRSMVVNCAAGEYAYIAYPSRLGLLTSIVIGGFESIGDFWIDHKAGSELAITNAGGYTENYYVYVSKNPSFTDPTTMVVSL